MNEINLRNIDLNLLVVLKALLETKNVSKAGKRIGLSQPAMSRALGRLRDVLNDPLFIRTNKGLIPTPRAEQLSIPLETVLIDIQHLIQPPEFDPQITHQTFRLITLELTTQMMISSILQAFYQQAPNADIIIKSWNPETLSDLEKDTGDVALGVYQHPSSRLNIEPIAEDSFVCVVRNGHPLLEGELTLERYAEQAHTVISLSGLGKGPVDYALERLGVQRRIALRIPHYMAALETIQKTDLIMTFSRNMMTHLAPEMDLVVLELPFYVPSFHYGLFWHERRRQDPAHQWFRQFLFHEVKKQFYQSIIPQ